MPMLPLTISVLVKQGKGLLELSDLLVRKVLGHPAAAGGLHVAWNGLGCT